VQVDLITLNSALPVMIFFHHLRVIEKECQDAPFFELKFDNWVSYFWGYSMKYITFNSIEDMSFFCKFT